MSAAHVHLMLNHVPVLGAVFAAVVLTVGLLRSDESWQGVALWTLVVTGVAAVVVYLTGEPAEELVEGAAGFSHAALERHEEVALWAAYGGGGVGAAALGVLTWFRSRPIPRTASTAMLLLAVGLTGVMAWTANTGGKVSHPELRGATTVGATEEAGVERGRPSGGEAEQGEGEEEDAESGPGPGAR